MSSTKSSTNERAHPVELRRIARRRVSDDVYDQIRQAILERQFLPGKRLSIPDLAARFDVSQMPVRQAVERLHDDGLVEVRPRSGTFVAQAEERDIAETFDIRRSLERLASETAVVNAQDSDISELDDLVTRMDELAVSGPTDHAGHDRLNSEFHRRIVALSGNQKLSEMYDDLNAHLRIARVHVSSSDWATRVEREQAEHREILAALRRRAADLLADALTRHIHLSKTALIADIQRLTRAQETP